MHSACISCKLTNSVRDPKSGKKWNWYPVTFFMSPLTDACPASLEFWIRFTHTNLHGICSHPLNILFIQIHTEYIYILTLNYTDYLHGIYSPLEGQNTSPVNTASTQLAERRSLIFTTSLVNGSLKRLRQQCVNIDETVRLRRSFSHRVLERYSSGRWSVCLSPLASPDKHS